MGTTYKQGVCNFVPADEAEVKWNSETCENFSGKSENDLKVCGNCNFFAVLELEKGLLSK